MFKRKNVGAGETIQWLRAVVALAEDLGSVPKTLMMAHDHL